MAFQVNKFTFVQSYEDRTHCIVITKGNYDYSVPLYYNPLFSIYKQYKKVLCICQQQL